VLVMYIFGLCFLQATTAYLVETPLDQADPFTVEAAIEHWGSIFKCMMSLYMAITGGSDWAPLAEPLLEIGEAYYFLFLFYIALLSFAILNVLTGIFAEQATEVRKADQENIIHEEMERDQSCKKDIRRLFNEIDKDRSGSVVWSEFTAFLENDDAWAARVRAFFRTLEIEMSSAKELFQLMEEKSKGGRIRCDDFIESCVRYKGNAKMIDVTALQHDTRTFSKQLAIFMLYTEERFNSMFESLVPGLDENPVYPLMKRLKNGRCPVMYGEKAQHAKLLVQATVSRTLGQ